jgi:chloramphenicol-sensitive protein RarD
VYGEAFTPDRMIGFGLIWLALAIYSVDSFRANRRNHVVAPAA